MKPLVSIITPCYNGEKFLDRYFESILAQTYDNLELIFVNDGSQDRTEEIALAYSEKLENKGIRYIYKKQQNAGQAAALNSGLKKFNGEYVTWPDSDDLMTPDCIEKKVEFLENNPQFALCICKTKVVEENAPDIEKEIYQRIPPMKDDNFFEDLIFIRNVYFTPGAYMVRSKQLLNVLPDREIYCGRGGQNCQILLPLLYHYQCGYMQDVLNTYFVRNTSHSHSINDSGKMIEQINLYETILLETLKKISESVLKEYEMPIKCHYGKQKFGNALDSGNTELIKREYQNLKRLGCATLKDKLLYIKKVNFKMFGA